MCESLTNLIYFVLLLSLLSFVQDLSEKQILEIGASCLNVIIIIIIIIIINININIM